MAAPAHIARENGRKGGRPKGSGNPHIKAKMAAEALLIEEAKKHIPDIVNSLVEAAKGMWVEIKRDGQTVRVYRKPAEVAAIKEFLDRIMGKAKQPIDFQEPLVIELSKRAKEMGKKYRDD